MPLVILCYAFSTHVLHMVQACNLSKTREILKEPYISLMKLKEYNTCQYSLLLALNKTTN